MVHRGEAVLTLETLEKQMHAAMLILCVLSHLLQWSHWMDSTQNLKHQQRALFPTAMSLWGWWTGMDRRADTKSVKDIKPDCGRERGEEMENEGITYAGEGPLFICLQSTVESNKPWQSLCTFKLFVYHVWSHISLSCWDFKNMSLSSYSDTSPWVGR